MNRSDNLLSCLAHIFAPIKPGILQQRLPLLRPRTRQAHDDRHALGQIRLRHNHAFRHFFDVLGGRHLTSEEAVKLPFSRVRIESETDFSVEMDGDPAMNGKRVDLKVEKQALNVLLPPSAKRLLSNHSNGSHGS